jgi:hypothetical protein
MQEMYDEIYKLGVMWRTSWDVIVAFRTGDFAKKECEIEKQHNDIGAKISELEGLAYRKIAMQKTASLTNCVS